MRIKDILEAPNLEIDGLDIARAADLIAYKYFDITDWAVFPVEGIDPYRVELKGYRNYDGCRAAALYVIYHENDVICICSFAGRSLQDTCAHYVYDHVKLRKFVDLFFIDELLNKPNLVFDENDTVNVVYWEGCPIQLGERIFGYDD